MGRNLPSVAFAAALLSLISGADVALAQKQGGVLKMYHFDSPASLSLHEEVTFAALGPAMGLFNNLVMFDQHVPQASFASIVLDLATEWNEPPNCADGDKVWDAAQLLLYQKVRAFRHAVKFVVYGHHWGDNSQTDFISLDPAPYLADINVLFTFHYYDPFVFTGQGLSWLLDGRFKYLTGLTWPMTPATPSPHWRTLWRSSTRTRTSRQRKAPHIRRS